MLAHQRKSKKAPNLSHKILYFLADLTYTTAPPALTCKQHDGGSPATSPHAPNDVATLSTSGCLVYRCCSIAAGQGPGK